MGEIKESAHTKWRCEYHIVFAPKYRRKEIYGKLKADIGQILRKLCEEKKVEILEAQACSDHIHMLVSVPPHLSIDVYKRQELLKAAGIVITEEEAKRIEYCDYHLGEFDTIGTEILTYVNTDRVCAKEMMLTPYPVSYTHLGGRPSRLPGSCERRRPV